MTVDEPTRWLQDASTSVKRNSFYMKKALVSIPNTCTDARHLCSVPSYQPGVTLNTEHCGSPHTG